MNTTPEKLSEAIAEYLCNGLEEMGYTLVKNSGCVMSEEHLAFLLEPFLEGVCTIESHPKK